MTQTQYLELEGELPVEDRAHFKRIYEIDRHVRTDCFLARHPCSAILDIDSRWLFCARLSQRFTLSKPPSTIVEKYVNPIVLPLGKRDQPSLHDGAKRDDEEEKEKEDSKEKEEEEHDLGK